MRSSTKKMTNNNKKFGILLNCGHNLLVDAAFLSRPVRHDFMTKETFYVCPKCYAPDNPRKWRESGPSECSMNPVHSLVNIVPIPPEE
jgi:hypothetical protein